MAPRVEEDVVVGEYDVFLTPAHREQIYLLQYPNRNRDRPYNARFGARPNAMRIKPKTGYLELDVKLNTEHNFNNYQGLKWGDAMRTAKELQNNQGTFGLATGFSGIRSGNVRGAGVKDKVDRELAIENDLAFFEAAEKDKKVMSVQALGGQITKHDSLEEIGKPFYFVGAFKGSELHLSKVAGTVQMRPQFHHVDAEDQRNRLAASREYAASAGADGISGPGNKRDEPRAVQQSYKLANPKGELDQRQDDMKNFMMAAAEEKWVRLDYVDEDEDEAYTMWHQKMFVDDVDRGSRLQSSMDNEEYLDAISAPRYATNSSKRKKRGPKKDLDEANVPDGEAEGAGE